MTHYRSSNSRAGLGWLVAVGLAGFLFGRITAEPDSVALPEEPATVSAFASLPDPAPAAAPEPDFVPEPEPVPQTYYEPAPVVATYYRNCAAARAAGAAPVRIGDPGYAPHLDRDRDGVGCE